MPAHIDAETERSAHPFAFTILYLPYGMATGYVTVTLVYLLSHAGLSVERVAALVTLQLLPQTWKVLWAPVVDTTLSARRWYLISTVTTGLAILAMTLTPPTPSSMWLLDLLVLFSSIACSFSAMSTEWLMAHSTADHQKGRAGGWSQAGNLGGLGLGGGLALWMSQHTQPWGGGALLALLCLLCAIPPLLFKEQRRPRAASGSYSRALRAVGRDVWDIGRTRVGFLTMLLFILPIGTGAASGLWSAVADDWRGDVLDRKSSYALAGIVQALCVTLETIGRRSAATNYNLLACFSNIPIAYMTTIDGHAQGRWGSGGMLYTEAALCACAVFVFAATVLLTRPRGKPALVPAA